MTRMTSKALILAAIHAGSLALPTLGQHINESVPRSGESRANVQQYLSSHNSYQGDISLISALDFWNVWDIELDVRWRDNPGCIGGGEGFYVLHHCADFEGEGWLSSYLAQIASTERIQHGFFFMNLELDDDYVCLGCFEGPDFPSGYMNQLENQILNALPFSSVYTWQDFLADGKQWPSVQELVRRDKHVAIFTDDTPFDESTMFFRRCGTTANLDPCTLRNFPSDQHDAVLLPQGDHYMSRRYPEFICYFEDGEDWVSAYNNGFNFVSTNCIEFHAVDNAQFFHPPYPAFAEPGPPGGGGLGTANYPYSGADGLLAGLDRIASYDSRTINQHQAAGTVSLPHPSLIEIELLAGDYDVASGGPVVLDAPVRLFAAVGDVTLH